MMKDYTELKIIKGGKTGTVFIYVLIDPIMNQIRYVGKTKNINNRVKEHVRESRVGYTHKNNWIKGLKGIKPYIGKANSIILKLVDEHGKEIKTFDVTHKVNETNQ